MSARTERAPGAPSLAGFLTSRRAGRRPQWVVKRLGRGSGSLRSMLRPDLLDLSSLGHPALALPGELWRDGTSGEAFLLRPRVEGVDLLAASRGRSPREVLPWLAAAADALGILHRHGFLHRNLKATNILVTRDALLLRPRRGVRVVLSDPAWWRETEDAARSETVPPEVQRGEAPSPASDLHAFGAVIRQIIRRKDTEGEPAGLGTIPGRDAGMDVDLDRLAAKLLQAHPARRYQSAAAVAEDLRRLAGRKAPPVLAPADCLLGRKEEIDRAAARLEAALGASPLVLEMKGPAGIGKTVFLRRITLEAQVLGYRTVAARCYPERSERPPLVHAVIEELLAAHSRRRKLRDIYRQLLGAGAAPDDPGPGGDARRRLVRGLGDLLVKAAAERPTLIAIDDAEFADPLTIEVLADCARATGRAPGDAPRRTVPPSLAITCRTEGKLEAALRPLEVAALAGSGDRLHVVALEPLPAEAVEELLAFAGIEDEEKKAALSVRLRGHPLAISEALRHGGRPGVEEPGAARALEKRLRAITPDARRIVDAISVLGRPAPPDLLAGLLRASLPQLQEALDALVETGTLAAEGGAYFFRHGSLGARLRKALERRERLSLHGRIALFLERHSPEAAEEIARHWLESDAPERATRHAVAAARRLARGHDPRGAVSFYEAAIDGLPRGGERLRRVLLEESAEALSRSGDHRRAAGIVLCLLRESGRKSDAGRLQRRAGSYLHRAGRTEEAAVQLERSARALSSARGRQGLRELLRAWSELAEIRSNQGDYERAEAIAREALDRAAAARSGRKDPGIRREEMVLLETLAHLDLRRFRYREARELFEKSLEAGRLIGAAAEQSLILNNLGTLHIQESRFREALGCYERAVTLSAGLGDDQSLSIVHANLAILHARLGDPDGADAALARAKEREARGPSARSRYVRLHAAGLVDLALGRYASAVDSFQEAIRTGQELGDLHMVAFDLVFLGEARLLRGEMKAARAALDRAISAAARPPPPVPPMVEARRALLSALRGDRRGSARALEADRAGEASVPYVEAWNRLFRGWALRLLRRSAEAEAELRTALDFFVRAEVPSGEVHASLELAATELEGSRAANARKRIRALRRKHPPGRGALRSPMLAARLLAYEARVALAEGSPAIDEIESLLVDAEGHLIGRGIRDLEALVGELRAALRARQPAPAPHGSRPGPEAAGGSTAGRVDAAPAGAQAIIGRSGAIRRVVTSVLEAAPSLLPVLITGETGSGKDVVARAIHEESPRRAAPLVSINCAAIPRELIEDELFGHARGAFTGADGDREGLLASAHGGSFLFDEVGDLPVDLQAKLLRALTGRRVRPIGAREEIAIDVRFLFATSRDLPAMADAGSFRRDLYYRLRVFEIRVPPLRERPEDVPILVDCFRQVAGGRAPAFDEGALRTLAEHPWPGNVRELQNLVARLEVTGADRSITEADVRAALDEGAPGRLFPPALLRSRSLEELQADLEREYLADLHARHQGDLAAMADVLRISTRALYDRFRKLGLRPRDLRGPATEREN